MVDSIICAKVNTAFRQITGTLDQVIFIPVNVMSREFIVKTLFLLINIFISMKIKFLAVPVLLLAAGCEQGSSGGEQDYLIQSALWYQQSAEMEALYYQAYNWAGKIIKERYDKDLNKPPAVVLDIDETVLDNSPSTGFQIHEDLPYSEDNWTVWCNLEQAEALPGSLAFTRLADSLNVEVFYISNRRQDLMNVTLQNLQKLGFPNADTLHVLLKKQTSSKDLRRELVREKYNIILLIGDNLGDFDGIFEDRTDGHAKRMVSEESKLFGTEYIILPNPIYGSWDKPFRKGEGSPAEIRKQAIRSFSTDQKE